MSTSEIAKLESRWRENPNGLTFAPLAEAYRKQKDAQRALEILLPGLGKHPDYIPANIVLGRCHWDLEDLPAAEQAFTHVLELDGENVIALKALADITERLARYDESERWLEALLAVDRSNDEARAQLSRIRDLERQQAEGSAAVPERTAAESPEGVEPLPAPEAFEPSPEPPALEEASSVEYIGWVARPDDLASPVAPLPLEDLEPANAPEGGAPERGAPERGAPEVAAQPPAELPKEPAVAFAPPEPPPAPPPLPEIGAFGFEQSEEIVLNVSGQTEYQTPSAVDDLIAHVAGTPPGIDDLRRDLSPEEPITSALPGFVPRKERPAAEPEPGEETVPDLTGPADFEPPPVASLFGRTAELYALDEPPAAPEPSSETERVAEPERAPEPQPATRAGAAPAGEQGDAPAVAEPELVVTETMAEVFLRQGHVAEAITVYRELVRRGPGTDHLLRRLAELESRQAAAPPPRPAYAARETGGQSVAAFFQALLQARPGDPAPRWPARPEASAAPESPPDEAPATRPAGEPLSLGSVFGDEPPPVAPAVGRPSGETPAPGGAASGSFDDFFGAPAPGAGPAQPPATGRQQGRSGDDLDQFHAWLQSLKR